MVVPKGRHRFIFVKKIFELELFPNVLERLISNS